MLSAGVRQISEACPVFRVLFCSWWSFKDHKYILLVIISRQRKSEGVSYGNVVGVELGISSPGSLGGGWGKVLELM